MALDESLIKYRLELLSQDLKEVSEKMDTLIKNQHEQDKRLTITEIRSGFFGTIGGVLSIALVVAGEWLKNNLKP
jgi:hypothetical protein